MQKIVHNKMTVYGSNESVEDLMEYIKSDNTLFDFNNVTFATNSKSHMSKRWGSKSNALNVIQLSCNTLRFDTVAFVPTNVFMELSEIFRDVTIFVEYYSDHYDAMDAFICCRGIIRYFDVAQPICRPLFRKY